MCMQFPQLNCTKWFPFALYVETKKQLNYFLTKRKSVGYFIHDLHKEKVMLFAVVMDSVERWDILGRVAHSGFYFCNIKNN